VEALQTHGKYQYVWSPPKPDRFAVYERNDESWLLPLGFGTVAKTPLPLYDVRLAGTGELVGYINQNPVDTRSGRMRFSVMPDSRNYEMWTTIDEPQIEIIELIVGRYGVESDGLRRTYLAWMADSRDAAALVRSGILTHGPDNKEKFLYELRCRDAISNFRY
jgi:hypothetical protein